MTNEAAWIVAEYNRLRSLAKLGFRADLNELPAYLGDLFSTIADEVAKMESDDIKKGR